MCLKVRREFKTNSRFFFGKNNVMAIALGKDAETEQAKDLCKVDMAIFFQ